MGEFIWNVNSAEEVRAITERVLRDQAEDLEQRAQEAEKQIEAHEERIAWLEANIPAYTTVSYSVQVATTVNGVETTRTEWRERRERCSTTTQSRRDEIELLRELIIELQKAIVFLRCEAEELRRATERANRLFREMFELAQDTDARYAARIAEKKLQIIHYLNRIKELRGIIGTSYPNNTVGDVMMNRGTFDIAWDMVREALAPPRINDQTAHSLAWFFALQDSIEGQERFLNYLADKVEITSSNVQNQFNNVPFTVCPVKVAQLQSHLATGIMALTFEQQQAAREGRLPNDPQAEADAAQRLLLIERFTLLEVVREIAEVTTNSWDITSGTIQRILGGSPDSDGPFSLRELRMEDGMPLNGIGLFVQHATLNTENRSDNFPPLVRLTHVHNANFRGNNEVRIYPIISTLADIDYTTYFGRQIAMRHQFDPIASLVSMATDAATFAALAASWKLVGAGTIAAGLTQLGTAITAGGSYVVAGQQIASKLFSEFEKANKIQNDINALVEASRFGNMLNDFFLDAVLVSETGRETVSSFWATHYTPAAQSAYQTVVLRQRNVDVTGQPIDPHLWAELYTDDSTASRALLLHLRNTIRANERNLFSSEQESPPPVPGWQKNPHDPSLPEMM